MISPLQVRLQTIAVHNSICRLIMKFFAHLVAMLLLGSIANAQTSPTVMIINGKTVSKKEFEDSYRKNRSVGGKDGTSVCAFADLFVDYKLKVQAALDAHLDSLSSCNLEVESYERRPKISLPNVENEAKTVFVEKQRNINNSGGVVKTAQILLRLGQRESYGVQRIAKGRIDSIYAALLGGANFIELARKCSEDSGSAAQGGSLPWLTRGQTVKAFEDVAFSLKKGEISKPFLTEYGYHIVKLIDRQELCPYDSVKDEICKFVDARNLMNNIEKKVGKALSVSDTDVCKGRQPVELSQDVKEALLINEICKREIWTKAVNDERGLIAYYTKNKKKYKGVDALLKKRDGKKKVGLEDIKDLVVADYQDLLEKQWVSELRKKYKVVVFPKVLATVNIN